jgi:hypothetical protein
VCFRGVLPPSAGVALALDWACTKPKRRLAVATSGGCAYLFTLDGGETRLDRPLPEYDPRPALSFQRLPCSTGETRD